MQLLVSAYAADSLPFSWQLHGRSWLAAAYSPLIKCIDLQGFIALLESISWRVQPQHVKSFIDEHGIVWQNALRMRTGPAECSQAHADGGAAAHEQLLTFDMAI